MGPRIGMSRSGLKAIEAEVPDGQLVRNLGFHCHGPGSIPGRGIGIPQAECHGNRGDGQ